MVEIIKRIVATFALVFMRIGARADHVGNLSPEAALGLMNKGELPVIGVRTPAEGREMGILGRLHLRL